MATGSPGRVDGIERFAKCLKASLDSMRKRCAADVIIVGSEKTADLVRRSLDHIQYDAHIIVDDQSPENYWSITSYDALGKFPGSGRN